MHGEGEVIESCKKTLADLQLDYLDLYLVHWPFPNYHAPGCDGYARNPDSKPYIHDEYMVVWRQMEQLVEMGVVKSIGSSNMSISKMDLLLRDAKIKPVVNEMEIHPHFLLKPIILNKKIYKNGKNNNNAASNKSPFRERSSYSAEALGGLGVIGGVMKAAYLPGNSTVEFREVDIPEPGPGQVLLKTKSSTICGSDIRAIYREHLGKGPEAYQDKIAGHEPCGQIVNRSVVILPKSLAWPMMFLWQELKRSGRLGLQPTRAKVLRKQLIVQAIHTDGNWP